MVDLTLVFEAVIALLFSLITAFLIPYIRRRFGEEKFDEMLKWLNVAILAAENIFKESNMGENKKEYVKNFLSERGYNLDLDELDALIESQVYLLVGKENE